MSDVKPAGDSWRRFPCKIWTGAVNGRGYGHHAVRGSKPPKWMLVHREALEQKLGRPIAPGLFALHHCDTPLCHEPEHLYEGTQKQNMHDMASRGRQFRQVIPLSEHQVIRQRYAAGGITHRQLAAEYGVKRAAITAIIRNDPNKVTPPREKITAEGVREARRRHAAGEPGYKLAPEFGISESQLYRILKRERWASVE